MYIDNKCHLHGCTKQEIEKNLACNALIINYTKQATGSLTT